MASKTVNTKISLRYDTIDNWKATGTAPSTDSSGAYIAGTGTASQYVPLKGEVCIAEISTDVLNSTTTERKPTMLKVGDGKTKFSALDWLSAKAADIYSWARQSESDFLSWAAVKGNFAFTDVANTFTASQTVNGSIYAKDTSKSYTVTSIDGGKILVQSLNDAGAVGITNITGQKIITDAVAADTITTTNTITATGSITTKSGIEAAGDITTSSGNITVSKGNISVLAGSVDAPTVSTGTLTATTGIKGASTYTNAVKIPDEAGTIITDYDTSSKGTQTLAWGSTSTLATINGTDVKVTMPEKPSYSDTTYTFATGTKNGTFNVTPSSTGTAQSVSIYGLDSAAYKGVDTSIDDSSSANLPTSKAVKTYVADQISGKSSVAYVIDSSVSGSYCNTEFNVAVTNEKKSAVEITSGTIKTIDGKELSLGGFKVGDIIYTKAAGIKDWFYSGSTQSGDLMVYTFYQISGDTPVLDDYINNVTSPSTGDYVSGLSKSGSTLTASKSSFNALSIAGIEYKPNASATVNFVGEGATTVSTSNGTVTILSPKSITGVDFQINKSGTSEVTPAADGTIAFSVKGTNLTVTKEATDNAIEYTIAANKATSTTLGAIKTGYTTSDKNYAVKVDDSGNAYVNVPWSNTDTWRAVKINSTEKIASNASTPLNLVTNNPSWGSFASTDYINIRYDSNAVQLTTGAKVVTTDDVLILNGGTATTVI